MALLWLLERWRLRPLEVAVADVTLFAPSPAAEAEARAQRRRVGCRWLLRAAAALALAAAAADPRVALGPPGPVRVDVVLDRGLASATLEGGGARRIDLHRRHLDDALGRLRDDDAVRLHLLPAGPGDSPTPRSPSAARAALAAAEPVAALADLPAALARLLPPAQARRVPVLVATDRPLPEHLSPLLVALAGGPLLNRGLIGLREEEGDLVATVAFYGAAAPVQVHLAARSPAGRLLTATHEARPAGPAGEGVAFGFARWRAREGYPAGALEASARLEAAPGADALPLDDRAFAVRAPLRPRRVGVAGEPGAAVRRALAAVPGVATVDLPALEQEDAGEMAGAFDLLVLPRLPQVLPPVAVVVVPEALDERDALPGGLLQAGPPTAAFRHTQAALGRQGVAAARLGAPPAGLPGATPVIEAGGRPLVLAQGAGERLVAVVTAPLDLASSWTRHGSFPLFWAELLEAAAPARDGALAAVTAGASPPAPVEGAPRPLLEVRRYTTAAGAPWVGTVAAALPPALLAADSAVRPFDPEALDRLEAARPPPRPRSLRPPLALLALLLAAAAWWPGRDARPGWRVTD